MVGGEVAGLGSRILVFSLKLPSSTWLGVFVLAEKLKILLSIFNHCTVVYGLVSTLVGFLLVLHSLFL